VRQSDPERANVDMAKTFMAIKYIMRIEAVASAFDAQAGLRLAQAASPFRS
jgi:hypothetical protein